LHYELINSKQENSLLTQVFINRGFSLDEIEPYLNTTDDDILAPELLDNIDEAANLLINSIERNNNITLIVD